MSQADRTDRKSLEKARRQRDDERWLVRASTRLSEGAFAKVWDNPEDSAYDFE